ncbi:unnamed protein product [Paramecium sonneborni]|uniref:Alpha/beta hydrolase n=1 Tax=Paramecium sonneborni TaxID=65129 RepID=A0A8S1NN39_9CILI|nr:unnamed protein product [Paramecium sonneborni]
MNKYQILWICLLLIILAFLALILFIISPNKCSSFIKKIKCYSGSLLDKLIFPARSCNKYQYINEKDINYFNVVKKNEKLEQEIQNQNCSSLECKRTVPYAFLQNEKFKNTKNYVIYFHGNGETIDEASEFVKLLMNQLKFHAFLIEYPQYGIYNHDVTNAQIILEDSIQAYNRIKEEYKLEDSQILIFGRSIGTGPAIYVASQVQCKGLIVISAYRSIIQQVRGMLFGIGFLVSKFMEERFNNEERISNIQCPTLYIHGLLDTLIPHTHSIFLNKKQQNSHPESQVKLETFAGMNHNNISQFTYEISEKIGFFFEELNKSSH